MEKQKSNLGIISIILGTIGVVTSCMCIGIIPGIVGVILSVIGILKNNQKNGVCIVGLITSFISVLISLIIFIFILFTPTDTTESEYSESENTNKIQTEELSETTKNTTEEVAETTTEILNTETVDTTEITTTEVVTEITTEITTEEQSKLSEEYYKSNCQEMFYDDVFFGDNLSVGNHVKLYLMVSENYYFTADAFYSDSFNSLMDRWSLYRDFKKCSVLRENEKVYAGVGKVDLYFSNNYDYDPNNYDLGDKIIVYGEVINFHKDYWDGYNDVIIIPKYIEYQ